MACFDSLLFGFSLLMIAGCAGRTALEDGPGSGPAGGAGDGANGAGANGAGAGLSNYDPDEECPFVGCSGDEACEPAILTSGRAIGWATIDGGDLYFTTNDLDGDNALIRVPVCGGEEQILLERERFAGEGAIAGDYLYIPAEEPVREVLRLPKIGGAATAIHTHEDGDPYTTRAITAANGYVILSEYSFDGGLLLTEINPKGKAYPMIENMPDQDWFLVTSVASGFLPNKPAFIEPELVSGQVLGALIGSDLGIHRLSVYPNVYNDYTSIDPFSHELPVAGPLLTTGTTEADLTVWFSTAEDDSELVHYKLAGGVLEPILVESGGILLAVDGDQLFGSWNDFYMEGFEDDEFGGGIWQATEGGDSDTVFRTRFQNTVALEIHGASVYVRTTRAVVRFPKDCQNGDDRCHFHYEE